MNRIILGSISDIGSVRFCFDHIFYIIILNFSAILLVPMPCARWILLLDTNGAHEEAHRA